MIKFFALGLLLCISQPTLMQAVTADESDKMGEFIGAMETVYPDWFKLSFLDLAEDVDEATEEGKRFALIFTQDGCPYCNALIENNFSQKSIVDKAQENFDITTINIFGDREVVDVDGTEYTEKTFAKAMKVQFTPTMIFYDEKGDVALRVNGYIRPELFTVSLDYVAGNHENEIAYRDYVLANKDKINLNKSASAKALEDASGLNVMEKLSQNKPFAVIFEQTQCPACDTFHEEIYSDPDVQEMVKDFDVTRMNMWGNEKVILHDGKETSARAFAESLNVKYAPTIIFFAADGEEVIRSEAFFKVFHTQSLFHYVKSEGYKTEPDFQRFLGHYADEIIESGESVDIWRTKK